MEGVGRHGRCAIVLGTALIAIAMPAIRFARQSVTCYRIHQQVRRFPLHKVVLRALRIVAMCTIIIAPSLLAGGLRTYAAASDGCAEKVEQFVMNLDLLLRANPNSVQALNTLLDGYFPSNKCDVHEVINQSKKSKFFSGVFDAGWAYTISFRSTQFVVTFGVEKKTGNIILPAARVEFPRQTDQKI